MSKEKANVWPPDLVRHSFHHVFRLDARLAPAGRGRSAKSLRKWPARRTRDLPQRRLSFWLSMTHTRPQRAAFGLNLNLTILNVCEGSQDLRRQKQTADPTALNGLAQPLQCTKGLVKDPGDSSAFKKRSGSTTQAPQPANRLSSGHSDPEKNMGI